MHDAAMTDAGMNQQPTEPSDEGESASAEPGAASDAGAVGAAESSWPRRAMLLSRLALIVLCVGGITGTISVGYVVHAYGRIDHTRRVQVALETLRSTLQDAETGQRGFLLTGDTQYLEPYYEAVPNADVDFDRLRDLIRDNQRQQVRFTRLRSIASARLGQLASTVALARAGDLEAALDRVDSDDGRELMDEATSLVDEMVAEELRLLDSRSARTRVALVTLLASIALTTLLGTFLLVRAARLRRRSDFERAEAQDLREAAERQRAAEQRRFQQLVEQIDGYAIFATDTSGRVESWNEGVREVLGYPQDNFVGREIDPLIYLPADMEQRVADADRGGAQRAGARHAERWMRRADGNRFWAQGTVTALQDAAGRPLGFMYVLRDQTNQKHMEEELRQLTADLSEAARRKDEFLATLAHELRNPLAPIRTGLELMRAACDEPETITKVRDTLERQAQQLTRLVDDLLDVSRITRGKLKLHRGRVSLADVVRAAVETSQPSIDAMGHRLIIDLSGDSTMLDADPHRLSQVVSNLLNNAAKYTPEGGEIRLSARKVEGPDGDEAVLTVKDNGVGIPESMRRRIFEMFMQVESHREHDQSGLGIGLTLVRSLVEMHGGRVEVRSDGEGRGSEFEVRLPILAAGESVGDAGDDPASDAETAGPCGLTSRVLVVDDNRPAADLLAVVLRRVGYQVRTAYDGREALEVAAEFLPDAILMDIGMPRMNGYEAARELRQREWGRDVCLVAITGWGQSEDIRRTQSAGFDEHLVKPVDIALVRKVLGRPASKVTNAVQA